MSWNDGKYETLGDRVQDFALCALFMVIALVGVALGAGLAGWGLLGLVSLAGINTGVSIGEMNVVSAFSFARIPWATGKVSIRPTFKIKGTFFSYCGMVSSSVWKSVSADCCSPLPYTPCSPIHR